MTPAEARGTLLAGSHVAMLATSFMRAIRHCWEGAVAELGSGWWSTPLLHGMARVWRQTLYTLETDREWFDTLSELYASEDHRFVRVSKWKDAIEVLPEKLALAFVDFSPGEERVDAVLQLQDRADIIVAHDVEADIPPSAGAYGWARLHGVFRYEFIWEDVRPWTAVWSNRIDVRTIMRDSSSFPTARSSDGGR